MKKFYHRKEISQEKTPILMSLGRRHTMMEAGHNEDYEELNNRASRTHSVGSFNQMNSSRDEDEKSKMCLSDERRSNFSPISAVVITESELSSSWLYKDRKARINSDEESKLDPKVSMGACSPEKVSPATFLDSNIKPVPVPMTPRPEKISSCCCYLIVIIVICLASLAIMAAIGGIIYMELFAIYNGTINSKPTTDDSLDFNFNLSKENLNFHQVQILSPSDNLSQNEVSPMEFQITELLSGTKDLEFNSSKENEMSSGILNIRGEKLLHKTGLIIEGTSDSFSPSAQMTLQSSESKGSGETNSDIYNVDSHFDEHNSSKTENSNTSILDDGSFVNIHGRNMNPDFSKELETENTDSKSDDEFETISDESNKVSTVALKIALTSNNATHTEQPINSPELKLMHNKDTSDPTTEDRIHNGDISDSTTDNMIHNADISNSTTEDMIHNGDILDPTTEAMIYNGDTSDPATEAMDHNGDILDPATETHGLEEQMNNSGLNISDTNSTISGIVDAQIQGDRNDTNSTQKLLNQPVVESKPNPGAVEFLRRLGFEPRNGDKLPFLTTHDMDVKFSLSEALKYLRSLDTTGQLPTAREKSLTTSTSTSSSDTNEKDKGSERAGYLNSIRRKLFD